MDNESTGETTGKRDRRPNTKASSRAELLAKLRKQRETGEKFEVEEKDDRLFDYVDGDGQIDEVDDEWIVGDYADGYKSKGRDIFDESSDEEQQNNSDKQERKKNPNIRKPGKSKKLDTMFANMSRDSLAVKRTKENDASHDEILNSLLQVAASAPTTSTNISNKKKETLSVFKTASKPALNKSSHDKLIKTESESVKTKPTLKTETVEDSDVSLFNDDMMDDVQFDEPQVETTSKPDPTVKTEKAAPVRVQKPAVISTKKREISNEFTATLSDSTTAQTSNENLPTVEGDEFLFYWLEAYEDFHKHPGIVYLFGKTKNKVSNQLVSCCVVVKNINRKIFILPRQHKYDKDLKELTDEKVKFVEVYSEFSESVAVKFNIKKFKSKKSVKQYSFEMDDVPPSAEYLEVHYSADQAALPTDLSGETFSHIFGSNTSSLETFLLDRKIKGPCWLKINNPKSASHSMSWTKVEMMVENMNDISVFESDNLTAPTLTTLTLSMNTVLNHKTKQNEIVQVAGLVNNSYNMEACKPEKLFNQHFVLLSKPSDHEFPYDIEDCVEKDGGKLKLELVTHERQLLSMLLAKIQIIDPDVIIGHDISSFELNHFLTRVEMCKVPFWHKLSRLKRSTAIPKRQVGKNSQVDLRSVTCGRIVCDVKLSARQLVRCKSYDLTHLVTQILKQQREEFNSEILREAYMCSSELLRLTNLTIQDAFYCQKILFELDILPLAKQITSICGNILSRTLMGGRSERNEYLLLHAFSERNFIVPDKQYKQNSDKGGQKSKPRTGDNDGDLDEEEVVVKSARRKPAYAGGLVLEPKKGFYDTYILLLDFNSLYPSIIQEYNICFTTVTSSKQEQSETDELQLPELPDSSLARGVLPVEIKKLVDSRRHVKSLMKDASISKEQYSQYDIRQKALKLTANSMYGCLGFTYSRFYAKPLAALITAKGREILQATVELVGKQGLDVIYGDTDSIMINTNSRDVDEVFKLGNKVKAEVNRAYRLLEIDIDGIFKSMLLLKKKKYAALNMTRNSDGTYSTTQELKGLDIVRRDWCELAKQTGRYVVDQLLSGESKETILENIHNKLSEVKTAVNEGEIPLEHYCITKQLTKPAESYPDKKSLPHVQVALRLNSNSDRKLKGGDTVYYVICADGSNLSASQRAYHPDEVTKNSLTIDFDYYLSHQIHPVVSRLIDPIDGTDASMIATMLGLDGTRFKQKITSELSAADANLLNDEEKYADCEKLDFCCQKSNCGVNNVIEGPQRINESGQLVSSWLCKNSTPDSHLIQFTSDSQDDLQMMPYIRNKITRSIRRHVTTYYQGWLRCEDSSCNYRTRTLGLRIVKGRPVCQQCKKSHLITEYTDSQLYTQLSYYQYIFEHKEEKTPKTLSPPKDHLDQLHNFSTNKMNNSGYARIDLNSIFTKIYGHTVQ